MTTKINYSQVNVSDELYIFSHGKPSGFGNWWFQIGHNENLIFKFRGLYSVGKKKAQKFAAEIGAGRVKVLP